MIAGAGFIIGARGSYKKGGVNMSATALAEVCFIRHSAFSVETTNHILIFDYFAPGQGGPQQITQLLERGRDKKIMVFASHGHGDHYSKEVFTWDTGGRRITYVLSDDIASAEQGHQVTWVAPGQTYDIETMVVSTLRSTDLGVAFLVKCDGLVVYHAGDLNWWHWEGEPAEDNAAMRDDYKKQIDLLKGEQIDLAFVPVDPRLEQQYGWGLAYFLATVSAQLVFPMHFGGDYGIFARLQEDLRSSDVPRIAVLSAEGECVSYPLR